MRCFRNHIIIIGAILQFFQLSAQPQEGKPGSKGSYKVQEYYNVLAENKNVKEGPYELWYEGVKIVSGNFSNNEKEGLWKFNNIVQTKKTSNTEFNDTISEEIYYQGNYSQGKRNGVWKYYLNKKPLCIIYYKNDKKDSTWKSFYKNGALRYMINYRNGQKNGIDEHFSANGNKIYSSSYRNDTLNGNFISYNKDGQIRCSLEYKNGFAYNVFVMNDSHGNPLDMGTLKEGNGKFKRYDEDGKLLVEENFTDGLRDGEYIKYYSDNGKIDTRGEYKKGVMTDNWEYYDTKGVKIKTISYEKLMGNKSKINNSSDSDGDISFFAERMPEPQGGVDEIQSYFENNINYFKLSIDKPYIKKATLKFVVSSVGKIHQVTIDDGPGEHSENLMIQTLKSMPPWIPGFSYGFPVDYVQMRLPIKIKK